MQAARFEHKAGHALFVCQKLRLGFGLERFQFRSQFFLRFLIHPIDEENSVQVIRLVLDGAAEQAASPKFERYLILVHRFYDYDFRPDYLGIHFRETQASLRAGNVVA